jgi:hypothetical protein
MLKNKSQIIAIHQGSVGDVICGSGNSLFSCGSDKALFEVNIHSGQIIQ